MTIPWSVERDWEGATVAILASGPSMRAEDASYLYGRCRVIAINNQGVPTAGRPAMAPWADILYAADVKWWLRTPGAFDFAGAKVTIRPKLVSDDKKLPGVLSLKYGGGWGFDDRPTHLRSGGNSGYQALHLATHLGVKRALLLGFDMQPAADGAEHWFGDHAWRPGFKSRYDWYVTRFEAGAKEFTKRGVEVLNCTADSALKCFPFAELRSVV